MLRFSLTFMILLQESEEKKRARKWEENDFYSSDEDEYLDRTSNIKVLFSDL